MDIIEQAVQIWQQGHPHQAIECLNTHLKQLPQDADAWHLLGVITHQQGHFEQAAQAIQNAIQFNPLAHEYFYNLGNVWLDMGQPQDTCMAWQQTLKLKPDFIQAYDDLAGLYQQLGNPTSAATVYHQLGHQLQSQQQYPKAEKAYQLALQFDATRSETWNNLAVLFYQQGRYGEACQTLEKVIQLKPDYAEAHMNLAMGLFKLQQSEKALVHLDQAVTLNRDYAPAFQTLADEMQAQEQFQTALYLLERSLPYRKYNASDATLFVQLANLYMILSEPEQAEKYLDKAIELRGNIWWLKLCQATLLPQIYTSRSDLNEWRARYEKRVDDLLEKAKAGKLKMIDNNVQFLLQSFLATYQGLNDCEVNQKIARVWRLHLEAQSPRVPELTTFSNIKRPKFRIGILSCFFKDHSVMHCFMGLILLLAEQPDMEIICLTPQTQKDHVTAQVEAHVDKLVMLSSNIHLDAAAILKQELDLLIYTDVGTDIYTYMMSSLRLAPIQCVLSGHPDTTGIKTLDYYISSVLLESQQAQSHYSEKVVCLKGLPSAYARPKRTEPLKSKRELGLPEDKTIYLCPMTLFKIHPDFDHAIAAILRQDQNAVCMFFKYKEAKVFQKLIQRFEKYMPDVVDRIHFLDWAPRESFLHILVQVDVVLDTFHFGGGNTNFLALGMGTPLITWPSEFPRGRSANALYQLMNFNACIAPTQEDYAPLAIKIANDKAYNQQLRQEILAKNDVLFDNQDGNIETVNFFRSLLK